MVDLVGIEPTTSSMPWKRAPSCATGPRVVGRMQPILAYLSGLVKRPIVEAGSQDGSFCDTLAPITADVSDFKLLADGCDCEYLIRWSFCEKWES
jgi:hypothetical protein